MPYINIWSRPNGPDTVQTTRRFPNQVNNIHAHQLHHIHTRDDARNELLDLISTAVSRRDDDDSVNFTFAALIQAGSQSV